MPRGRMLNKKISYDERISELSLKAKLLYTWCIPHLDVKGRIYGIAEYIKGNVVPMIKEIKISDIKNLLQEMANLKLIILYGKDEMYVEFTGFGENQNIHEERESKSIIPDPTHEQLMSESCVTPQQVKLSKVKLSKVKYSTHFAKPTPLKVEEYAKTISFSVSGQTFCDYYEARGWKYKGNVAMKDWKAAVRTWKKNQKSDGQPKAPPGKYEKFNK